MKNRIILLNGPSSSGKSTLAKELQQVIAEQKKVKYEIVSIDDFLKMTTKDVIYEDDVFEISHMLCEKVTDLLKSTDGVIIDHVITSERIFKQLQQLLNAYGALLVRVTCPLDILKKREMQRKNRCLGSAEASNTYLFPQEGYDLVVDTYYMTPRMCSLRICTGLQ